MKRGSGDVIKNTYKNGAIISTGSFFEKTEYNVSNETISVVFNSNGAITYYAEADGSQRVRRGYCNYYINDEYIDVFSEKTVEMIGRQQSISIKTSAGIIRCEEFLSRSDYAKIEAALFVTNIGEIQFISDGDLEIAAENQMVYLEIPEDENGIRLFVTTKDFDGKGFRITDAYETALAENWRELNAIKLPYGLTETPKAMFLSCYYCALENYKEKGDFKAFMAGHQYLSPMRSYYRDSYYTVLPMYNGNADKVRNQVITLAKGVHGNGDCPSAVKADYSGWWGNHYDSPSFLAMMLYDYVNYTGDRAILTETVGDATVFEKAETAVLKLSQFEDHTGLLYKEGKYNKRDWADNVNRYGYVTYDEILYARAWHCLSKLAELLGDDDKAGRYGEKFVKTKDAINALLYSEELGYYLNFRNEDYIETNLSIDTVFAAIFDIADREKALRMLTNMEKILECRNNSAVQSEDFGVMSVYPFYRKAASTCDKSSEPFNYHNGANWPYLSAMYAHAKRRYGLEYTYALESWFTYNVNKNNFTPIEYFSSVCPDGSLLQAWSGAVAFVLDETTSRDFWD